MNVCVSMHQSTCEISRKTHILEVNITCKVDILEPLDLRPWKYFEMAFKVSLLKWLRDEIKLD